MHRSNFFFDSKEALQLYYKLVLPRKIEERMLKLLRQNKLSKWFSGIGQEAIATTVAHVLDKQDYIMTMHRNLGVFTGRNVPFYPLFCQLFGKVDGFSQGRERSFHFGVPEHYIIGMISHLAAMLPVACGTSLAFKLSGKQQVSLAFCGEGATSEGDFHEALNLAAVWDLPVIFLVENNGYALSTPISEQFRCKSVSDKGIGYGIKSIKVDGNHLPSMVEAIRDARDYAISEQKPILIEAMTFRMRGHEEASGIAYIPSEHFDEWAKKDPILQFRKEILEREFASEDELDKIEAQANEIYKDDLDRALNAEEPVFNEEIEFGRVFLESQPVKVQLPDTLKNKTLRYIDGVSEALNELLTKDDKTIIIGQDIAEYGGAFKVTHGFTDKFGKTRIRNTPIIESGAVGLAIGLAIEGYKPIVEMQFADFISCGFNQIINNLAKTYYRWGQPLNVTIRSPHGAGVSAGPYHSQSPEGWFMQQPGLKVLMPSTVSDAYKMTIQAVHDPNPVLIFEHKKLYRSLKEKLAETNGTSFESFVARDGKDCTIVTYSMGVHWAIELAEKLEPEVSIEIVDLRCLAPIDFVPIIESVKKTNRVLVLEEAPAVLGPASEIASLITEHCFEFLDAPIMRCSSLHIPIPLNKNLETGYLATHRLEDKVRKLLRY